MHSPTEEHAKPTRRNSQEAFFEEETDTPSPAAMPTIDPSAYRPPPLLCNRHLQTILPSMLRFVRGVDYLRERIETPDGDFLDLDFSRVGRDRVVIVCHGLESSARENYVRGMVRAFNRREWDAVAMNFRGCSGEENRLPRSYHSGATEDLHTVVSFLRNTAGYRKLALVGFSLGGNLVIKYVGEQSRALVSKVVAAAGVSVPCDLASSVAVMSQRGRSLYMRCFAWKLRRRLLAKARLFPDAINGPKLRKAKTFFEFDEYYTGPVHGFKGAKDYWRRCSCSQFIPRIRIPTLLINARDDPLLSTACFPYRESADHPYFTLEVTTYGGHVGFLTFDSTGEFWHEKRIADFATTSCDGIHRSNTSNSGKNS